MVPTVEWNEGAVRLLDQAQLPEKVVFLDCRDYQTVARAIMTRPATARTRSERTVTNGGGAASRSIDP